MPRISGLPYPQYPSPSQTKRSWAVCRSHRRALARRYLLCLLLFLALAATGYAQTLEPAQIETLAGIKIGYKNGDGQTVIKPRYDYGSKFQAGGYAVVGLDRKYGCIDSTGREIVPLKFAEPMVFAEGLAPATLDGKKWGYIAKTGQVAVPFTFDDAGAFSEGRATVYLGKKAALINRKGTLLTPYKYLDIGPMEGGIARVLLRNDSRDGVQYSNFWGFINAQGQEITKLNLYGYESPNLGNGYAVARAATPVGNGQVRGEKYTFLTGQEYSYKSSLIDKTGKVVIPASMLYEFGNWGEGYIIVKRANEFPVYGVVDFTGKFLLPLNFREITKFEFGPDRSLAKVFLDERRFFYVDSKFQCVEFDAVKCPEY